MGVFNQGSNTGIAFAWNRRYKAPVLANEGRTIIRV